MLSLNRALLLILVLLDATVNFSLAYFDSRTYHDPRPLELYNEAVNFQRIGNPAAAMEAYRYALQLFPGFPEAHQNLAHLYDSRGEHELARLHHVMSITHASSEGFNASSIVNLVLHDLKTMSAKSVDKLYTLSSLLLEAERIVPNDTNVLFTHAQIQEHMGDIKACTDYLKRVLAIDDRHILAWLNLGNQWFKANNFEVATKFYKNALDRIPEGDFYNRVLVLNNLGQCYRERGMLGEAHASFYRALRSLSSTSTADTTPRSSVGSVSEHATAGIDVLYHGGVRHGRAVYFWCLNNLYTIQGLRCDWHHYELLEHTIGQFIEPHRPSEASPSGSEEDKAVINQVSYDLASFASEGVELDAYTMSLLSYASRAADKCVCVHSCPLQPQRQQRNQGRYTAEQQRRQRRLRVGYLSHDWRDHPMGRLTATLVTSHNRADVLLSTYSKHYRSSGRASVGGMDYSVRVSPTWREEARVDAIAVSYGANDSSEVRRYMEEHAATFIDVYTERNDMEVAQIIGDLQLDILVDITAHTYNGRIDIAAVQPAPVVINYLGFPGTTGCAGFAYSMVTAAIVPPEIASELFTESMLYLPHTYQSNDMPLRVAPPLCEPRIFTKTTTTHGNDCTKQGLLVRFPSTVTGAADVPVVPEGALLVCSFNANKKMEPISFRTWMNVLRQVPMAVLVMLEVSVDVRVLLERQAVAVGVAAKRLVFVPKRNWQQHLARSAECDLVLDTFVYGAHTTASDVLWMGVPLLSLAAYGSQRMPSRVAASITQALAVPHSIRSERALDLDPAHILVVDTVQEFEQTAVRLLRASSRSRQSLSAAITRAAVTGAAFDSELIQSAIEFAYQLAHEADALAVVRGVQRLPHIAIPSHYPEPAHDGVVQQPHYSWRKKFRRDVAALCQWDSKHLDVVLPLSVSNDAVILDKQMEQIEVLLADCASALSQHEDALSQLAAVLRRLVVHDPAYQFLHPHFTTANRSSAMNKDGELPPPRNRGEVENVFNCSAYLEVSCAVSYLSNTTVHPAPTCDVAAFPSALRYCYAQDAPAVLDFVMLMQELLGQANLHLAQFPLVSMLIPLAFRIDEQRSAAGEESARILFRRLTSPTKYVSPLWRNVSAEAAMRVVTEVLLVTEAPRALPQPWYSEQLRMLGNLRLHVEGDDRSLGGRTICEALYQRRGLRVESSAAQEICQSVLSRQLATILSEHGVLLDKHPQLYADGGNSVVFNAATESVRRSSELTPVLSLVIAYRLDPTDQRLLNLGTVLMDHDESEVGYFLSSLAVLRMAKALPAPVVDPLRDAARSILPRIVFYCDEYGQGWWPGWGPSSLRPSPNGTAGKGMGGSEEAVYYTANELAKRGYEVVVYAGVTDADHGLVQRHADPTGSDGGTLLWLHYDTYDPTPRQDGRCEVFIAWRYAISLGLAHSPRRARGPCGRKYLWLHDLISGNILPPSYFLHFDGIFVQSAFHKNFVVDGFLPHAAVHDHVRMEAVRDGVMVLPNGLQLSPLMDGPNDKNLFIYASAPGRGLALVLSQWRTIKAQIPDAVLEIYYGFTASALQELRKNLGGSFDRWWEQMQALLQQDGVKYIGSVDHDTLTTAAARAGYLLYPTTFAETGCITVLRAMACGAIPITSRLHPSVLDTLTEGWDLGPATALNASAAGDSAYLSWWLTNEWTPEVLRAHAMSDATLQEHRHKMKAAVRATSTWAQTADRLLSILSQDPQIHGV